MPRVAFGQVEDHKEFEPIPIGKHPCVVAVTNVQTDSEGNPMKDAEGNPAIRHTNAGDESWNVKATILDGKHIGGFLFDNLSFGAKAVKRVKVIFSRAGIIEGDETHDCEPGELDGTYWWLEVDRHEARINKDGTPKLGKNGKPLTSAKIGFAGWYPMDPKDAKKYREQFAKWEARQAEKNADNGEGEGDEVPF